MESPQGSAMSNQLVISASTALAAMNNSPS